MTSMIERVAKQLHETLSSQDIFGYLGANFDLHAVARATIEAMRQPTAFMADSGDEIFRSILASRYYTIPVWHSMIDAALKETDNAHDR